MKPFKSMKARQLTKRKQRGITLTEMLITLAIIAIVASIAGPKLMNIYGKSKVDATKIAMHQVASSLDMYKVDHGSYPTTAEGLAVLDMTHTPKDAWGHNFEYMSPGSSGPYDLISLGSDGTQGGSGNAADIEYANLK